MDKQKKNLLSFDLINVYENPNCSDLEAVTLAPLFPQSLFKLNKVLGNTTLFLICSSCRFES